MQKKLAALATNVSKAETERYCNVLAIDTNGNGYVIGDDTAAKVPLGIHVNRPIAVPFEVVRQFLLRAHADLQFTLEEHELIITSRTSKLGTGLMEDGVAEGIIDMVQDTAFDLKWKPVPDEFVASVPLLASCTGVVHEQPWTECVCILRDCAMVSDNRQIFKLSVAMPYAGTVPGRALSKTIAFMGDMAVSPGRIWFKSDIGVAFVRGESIPFPDLDSALNVNGAPLQLPAAFKQATGRLATLQEKGARVTVSLEPKRAVFRIQGQTAWIQEELKCIFEGEPRELSLSTNVLQEIASKSNSIVIGATTMWAQEDNWIYAASLPRKRK